MVQWDIAAKRCQIVEEARELQEKLGFFDDTTWNIDN